MKKIVPKTLGFRKRSEEVIRMDQTLRIKVTKKPPDDGSVVSYKTINASKLKKLLGISSEKVTIIVPGPDVAKVEILTEPCKVG